MSKSNTIGVVSCVALGKHTRAATACHARNEFTVWEGRRRVGVSHSAGTSDLTLRQRAVPSSPVTVESGRAWGLPSHRARRSTTRAITICPTMRRGVQRDDNALSLGACAERAEAGGEA